jgi:RNA polymerase sigma factor (sigma-70 family)
MEDAEIRGIMATQNLDLSDAISYDLQENDGFNIERAFNRAWARMRRHHKRNNHAPLDLSRKGRNEAASQVSRKEASCPSTTSDVEWALDVKDFLETLPERQRRVLCLREEGYTNNEIANELDVSPATASRLFGAATQRLELWLVTREDEWSTVDASG